MEGNIVLQKLTALSPDDKEKKPRTHNTRENEVMGEHASFRLSHRLESRARGLGAGVCI
jgi:hypothetical protein